MDPAKPDPGLCRAYIYSIFLELLDRFTVLRRWSQLGPVSSLDSYSRPAAAPGVLLELVPRWP